MRTESLQGDIPEMRLINAILANIYRPYTVNPALGE